MRGRQLLDACDAAHEGLLQPDGGNSDLEVTDLLQIAPVSSAHTGHSRSVVGRRSQDWRKNDKIAAARLGGIRAKDRHVLADESTLQSSGQRCDAADFVEPVIVSNTSPAFAYRSVSLRVVRRRNINSIIVRDVVHLHVETE